MADPTLTGAGGGAVGSASGLTNIGSLTRTWSLTVSGGEQTEFVLTRDSATAWRSHLGLWAVKERQADADRVVPGR